MDAQPDTDAFAVFVELTKAAIPEVAQNFHGNRIITDDYLLTWAAQVALGQYPQELLPQLFVGVMKHASSDVQAELAALLLSFYQISDDAKLGYRRDRVGLHDLRYRFELYLDGPKWLTAFSPHEYAFSIAVRVVVQHLIASGGWVLPPKIARRRARA